MQVMQADNANRAFRGNVAMQVHNLVDNFETKQCKWHHLMTKFWTSLQQIRKYTQKKYKSDFKKYNLKLRNMRASQLRFSSQTEQTLSTCVLILSSFLKRLDVFMHTLDSKFRYMITIIIVAQNDPIHHQAGIQSGSLVFSPRRTCPEPSPSSPSWFWTSTSTTPTRQLTSSSSMIRRMQRRLTTMWWRWRAASSTSMRTSRTCPPSPASQRPHDLNS